MQWSKKTMAIAALALCAYGQNTVTVITSVVPPVSPYISDWTKQSGKVMVTLVGSASAGKQLSIMLSARITGSNGISVATEPGYKPASPILLSPGSSATLLSSDLQNMFSPDHLVFTNISKNTLITSGLPEGMYQICVRAMDYSTGQYLSLDGTGCGSFMVSYLDPPIVMQPQTNDTVAATTPQHLLFTWSPVAGAPQGLSYSLRIVELMPPSRNANDALTSTFTFLSATTSATSYMVGPSDPQLTDGHNYAAYVTAIDPQNRVIIKNQGESNPIVFTYGKMAVEKAAAPPDTQKRSTNATATKFALPYSLPSNVSMHGVLSYEFASPDEQPAQTVQRFPMPAGVPLTLVERIVWHTAKGDEFEEAKEYSDPYTGVPSFNPPLVPGNNTVLATGVTDGKGNFSFQFTTQDTFGPFVAVLPENSFGNDSMIRVACVMVGSPYYCSPSNRLTPALNVDNNVGDLTAKVRSYSLTVTVRPVTYDSLQQIIQAPIGGVKVQMLRTNRAPDAPANEGSPPPAQPSTYCAMEVVAEGATDQAAGTVTFTHLVKSAGPSDKYGIRAVTDSTFGQYNYSSLATGYQFANPADTAVFNGDYVYPRAATDKTVAPYNPRIAGSVYRNDNKNTPIGNAEVDYDWGLNSFGVVNTSANGGFIIDNLMPQYDKTGYYLGGNYGLHILAPGFKSCYKELKPMKIGEQQIIDKILLDPDFTVSGTVVGENGYAVNAWVQIGGGAQVHAQNTKAYVAINGKPCPATFTTAAPDSVHQRLIATPDDQTNFFPETTYVDITSDKQQLAPVVVHDKKQRLRICVFNGPVTARPAPLGRAHVQIANISPVLLTDQTGVVKYDFQSGNSFTINVWGPDSADYLPKAINASIAPSKNDTAINVCMTRAASVSGTVTLNVRGSVPVQGAHVFIDGTGALPAAQATTDALGNFILHNVPIAKGICIKAAKSSNDTTFIGAHDTVDVTGQGVKNAHLVLKVFEDMDITRLLGFPVEIDSLAQSGKSISISGALVNIPSNSRFAAADTLARISFPLTAIIPGTPNSKGVPIAQPAKLPLVTELNSLPLVMGRLAATLADKTAGLSVAGSGGAGVISGTVTVSRANFKGAEPQLNGFSLLMPGPGAPSARLAIPAINSSKNDPLPPGDVFNIADSTGSDLGYTFHAFKAAALADSSFINGDTALLYTTLHTAIAHVADLNLKIGRVRWNPSGVAALQGASPLSFKIGQWDFSGSQWSITQDGLSVQKGSIQTPIMPVAFTGLSITPTGFEYGVFAMDTVPLVAGMVMTGGGSGSFGVSDSNYVLSAGAAKVENLPGCEGKVLVNNFNLKSNGDSRFTVDPSTLTLRKIASFAPSDFELFATSLVIPGMIDLKMPLVAEQPTAIMFSKGPGGAAAMDLKPFTMSWTVNNMSLSFGGSGNPEKFDSTGFSAKGTIAEPGKFSFAVNLKRALDTIGLTVDAGQVLLISNATSINGRRSLINVTGGMHVASGAWNNFHFAGDLTGANGAKGNLAFTAYGDIKADNQEVGVSNIPSPFGNLSLVYEPDSGRLVGNLHVDQTVPGVSSLQGDVDAVFDNSGWYFMGAIDMKVNDPESEGTALTLFGNYPMTQGIKDVAEKYSYVYAHKGSLPASFPTSVNGYFFEGRTSFPVQSLIGIPNVAVNLGLVSASLDVTAGADVRTGLDFKTLGVTAGMDAFYDIKFELGASLVVACGGVKMGLGIDQGYDGSVDIHGNWLLDVTGDVTVGGSVYGGLGICNSDCSDDACASESESKWVTYGIKGQISSDGKSITFYEKDQSSN